MGTFSRSRSWSVNFGSQLVCWHICFSDLLISVLVRRYFHISDQVSKDGQSATSDYPLVSTTGPLLVLWEMPHLSQVQFGFLAKIAFSSVSFAFCFWSDWFSSWSFLSSVDYWSRLSLKDLTCDERSEAMSSIVFLCNFRRLSCLTTLSFSCWMPPELTIWNWVNSASRTPNSVSQDWNSG